MSKSLKHKIIARVCLITLICFLFWFIRLYLETCPYVGLMTRLEDPVASYIRQNQGKFPTSEEDLINQFFFKKEKTADGFRYFITYDFDKTVSDRYWSSMNAKCFESVTISYGAKLDKIRVVEGKLFDEETGSQILLIDGPEKLGLKGYYENATLYWYQESLRYQKDKPAEVQEAESGNGQ